MFKRIFQKHEKPLAERVKDILKIDQERYEETGNHIMLICHEEYYSTPNDDFAKKYKTPTLEQSPFYSLYENDQEVRDVIKKFIMPHMRTDVYQQICKLHSNQNEWGDKFSTSVVLDVLINDNIEYMIDL